MWDGGLNLAAELGDWEPRRKAVRCNARRLLFEGHILRLCSITSTHRQTSLNIPTFRGSPLNLSTASRRAERRAADGGNAVLICRVLLWSRP